MKFTKNRDYRLANTDHRSLFKPFTILTDYHSNRLLFILGILTLFLVNSCRLKEDTLKSLHPDWTPNYIIPLAKGQLTIFNNLTKDSAMIKEDASTHKLFISFTDTQTIASVSDYITARKYAYNGKYKSNQFIKIPPKTINMDLPKIVNKPIGIPVPIPAIDTSIVSPLQVIDSVEWVYLTSGSILWEVTNTTPITFDLIEFKLIEFGLPPDTIIPKQSFVTGQITNLAPTKTDTISVPLAKGTIDSTLWGHFRIQVHFKSINGSGVNFVTISPSDGVQTKFTMTGLNVQSGSVILPSTKPISQNFDQSVSDNEFSTKLVEIRLKRDLEKRKNYGTMTLKLSNYFKIPLSPILKFPTFKNIANGKELSVLMSLDPRSGNSPFIRDTVIDLTDYVLDLSGRNKDSYNKFSSDVFLKLGSDGKYVEFDFQDSIAVSMSLDKLYPDYCRGWFGNQTQPFSTSFPFSKTEMFSKINQGKLDLKSAKLQFEFDNYVGIEIQPEIISLSSVNLRTGDTLSLNKKPPLRLVKSGWESGGQGTHHPNAIHHVDFISTYGTSIAIDSINTINIAEIFSNFPKSLSLKAKVTSNPNNNGETKADWTNYIYTDTKFKAKFTVNIPLAIRMTDVVITDTLPFKQSKTKAGQNGKEVAQENLYVPQLDSIGIKEGSLIIITENQIPMNIQIKIYLLDSTKKAVGTLPMVYNTDNLTPNQIDSLRTIKVESGKLGGDGKVPTDVSQWGSSMNVFTINQRLADSLNQTRWLRVVIRLNTDKSSKEYEYAQLYSDYGVNLIVSSDITLKPGSIKSSKK